MTADKKAIKELLEFLDCIKTLAKIGTCLPTGANFAHIEWLCEQKIKEYGGVDGANHKGSSTNGQQPDSETDRASDQ
jgi:hypothetical protein